MIQVNLQPWRKQKERRLLSQIIIIFIICLLIGAISIAITTNKTKDKNKTYQQVIQKKKQQNEEIALRISQIKTEQQTFVLKSELLKETIALKQQSEKIAHLLFLLLQWLPEQAWLNKVSIHKHNLTIEGSALNYSSITHFIAQAKQSSEFDNVNIVEVSHQKNSPANLNFRLEALW